MTPLAHDLAGRGLAAWNVEYRRVGQEGGGWPGTLEDAAAAPRPRRSAGGGRREPGRHRRALRWRAPRSLARGARPRSGRWERFRWRASPISSGERPRTLATAPVRASSAAAPTRCPSATPPRLPPRCSRSACRSCSSTAGATTSSPRSRAATTCARRRAAGDDVELVELAAADHFDVIEPGHAAWAAVCRLGRCTGAIGVRPKLTPAERPSLPGVPVPGLPRWSVARCRGAIRPEIERRPVMGTEGDILVRIDRDRGRAAGQLTGEIHEIRSLVTRAQRSRTAPSPRTPRGVKDRRSGPPPSRRPLQLRLFRPLAPSSRLRCGRRRRRRPPPEPASLPSRGAASPTWRASGTCSARAASRSSAAPSPRSGSSCCSSSPPTAAGSRPGCAFSSAPSSRLSRSAPASRSATATARCRRRSAPSVPGSPVATRASLPRPPLRPRARLARAPARRLHRGHRRRDRARAGAPRSSPGSACSALRWRRGCRRSTRS